MTPDKRVENPTFYETIVHSPQWQAWVRRNEQYPQWDVLESMECGWLSQGHFQAFLTQYHQDLMSEVVEKGWHYIVEATRKESWSKKEFIKSLSEDQLTK